MILVVREASRKLLFVSKGFWSDMGRLSLPEARCAFVSMAYWAKRARSDPTVLRSRRKRGWGFHTRNINQAWVGEKETTRTRTKGCKETGK